MITTRRTMLEKITITTMLERGKATCKPSPIPEMRSLKPFNHAVHPFVYHPWGMWGTIPCWDLPRYGFPDRLLIYLIYLVSMSEIPRNIRWNPSISTHGRNARDCFSGMKHVHLDVPAHHVDFPVAVYLLISKRMISMITHPEDLQEIIPHSPPFFPSWSHHFPLKALQAQTGRSDGWRTSPWRKASIHSSHDMIFGAAKPMEKWLWEMLGKWTAETFLRWKSGSMLKLS